MTLFYNNNHSLGKGLETLITFPTSPKTAPINVPAMPPKNLPLELFNHLPTISQMLTNDANQNCLTINWICNK